MNLLILGGSLFSLNIAGYLSMRARNYLWEKMFPSKADINYEKLLRALETVQNEYRVWHDLDEQPDSEFADTIIIAQRHPNITGRL